MYCPQCGQLIPDDAAHCPLCGAVIDMPLQRPGESWNEWKDRVGRWIVNSEQDDLVWINSRIIAQPELRTTFQVNPDYSGQTFADVMLKAMRRARKNQAFVTLVRGKPMATKEERGMAIAIDVDWQRLAGDDWLQQGTEELMHWRFVYESEREYSKTGEVTYEQVRREQARRAAKRAAASAPPGAGPPRRRGLFGRLRGRRE